MARDVFPTTMHTWIGRRLSEGDAGRGDVNRHLMSVYAYPLEVYFRGTSDQWLGDPGDVVGGFFADRLARPNFLADWQSTGIRLRRWLMNAFCLYLKEAKRRHRRDTGHAELPEESPTGAANVDRDMDRAFAQSLTREALSRTQQLCAEQGLEAHWGIFVRHYYEEAPYDAVGREYGVDPPRAAVMARTASRKFRQVMRDILMRDGAEEGEVDREIQELLEVTGA